MRMGGMGGMGGMGEMSRMTGFSGFMVDETIVFRWRLVFFSNILRFGLGVWRMTCCFC